ncbi:energy transducer TonB [Marinobacter sp.]|uniref:energy transducer TonB family protein n=1 Tax=Marinobacter sp. TaxID=50741 RepID=UPI001B6B4908|nr:energy transducer TonB [Marinobacter sp.]MBQ0834279.1 energy transducer TonB [Marinobacter sp.]
MLEHGSNNSLPAKYRIALALSTAFLIHTLLLSGVPAIAQDPPVQHRQQLNLELIATQSSHITPATHTPEPVEKRTDRNPPFEVLPDDIPSQPVKPVISTSSSRQKTASTEDSQAAAKTKSKPNLVSPAASSSPVSSPSKSGARSQVSEKKSSEDTTKITQSPAEQDPYLIKLAMHWGAALETRRVPAMRELADSSTMEVELQLLGNGALTRARVVKSTGIKQIDRAAYQAALAASPYPEPPPDQAGKSRFEVKLLFAPSRL